MRRITCPHCGYVGKLENLPESDVKIRCSKCRGSFTTGDQKVPPAPPSVSQEPPSASSSVSQPATEQPELQSGDWVETRVVESLGRRLVVVEKRNRLLTIACGILGVLCLASLTLQFAMARPERFADFSEASIRSEKSIGAPIVSATEIFTQRLNILDSKGSTIGAFGSKTVEDQSIATLELINLSDKARVSATSKAITMFDKNGRLRITIFGGLPGLPEETAVIGVLNENLKPAISLRSSLAGNEMNVFDPSGNLRLNMGAPIGNTYMKYIMPGDATPTNLVPD